MTDNGKADISLIVPNQGGLKPKGGKQNLSTLGGQIRRLSAVSANGAQVTIAVTASPKNKPGQGKGKKKEKLDKSKKKRSKKTGGAIILAFIIAIVAVVLAAWLVLEVKRVETKLIVLVEKLDKKTDVVADSLIKDCIYAKPWERINGVTKVYPVTYPVGINVYCDQITDGGGWTVFQRRLNGTVNFYRKWKDYEDGFGTLEGEFWMGLEKLHEITSNSGSIYELRIEMSDFDGNTSYAHYKKFRIGSAAESYPISIGAYDGTAGDSLRYHNHMPFSTPDVDNDQIEEKSCAVAHHGAWWYKACHSSNLNGRYRKGTHKSYADAVNWRFWKGDYYSMKTVEMKIRRKK